MQYTHDFFSLQLLTALSRGSFVVSFFSGEKTAGSGTVAPDPASSVHTERGRALCVVVEGVCLFHVCVQLTASDDNAGGGDALGYLEGCHYFVVVVVVVIVVVVGRSVGFACVCAAYAFHRS